MRKSSEQIVQGISERNMRARAATIRRVAKAEAMLQAAGELTRLLLAEDDTGLRGVTEAWVKATLETAEEDLEL